MHEYRYVPVIALLAAAIVLSMRKGDVPLALKGLAKMLGRPVEKREVLPVPLWRRWLAFAATLLAFAFCVV